MSNIVKSIYNFCKGTEDSSYGKQLCSLFFKYNGYSTNWLYDERCNNDLHKEHAILALRCFYGFTLPKETKFFLGSEGNKIEQITITKPLINNGGSKIAVGINNDKVIMIPNTMVDGLWAIRWWDRTVRDEAKASKFLNQMGVPALNREEGVLLLTNPFDEEDAYYLKVLVSDSFDAYKKKGWYIYDTKKGGARLHNFKEVIPDDFSISKWGNALSFYIKDMKTLAEHGIIPGTDDNNYVVINNSTDFMIRYFGFDFSGKYGGGLYESFPIKASYTELVKSAIYVVLDGTIEYSVALEMGLPCPYDKDYIEKINNFDKTLYKCFVNNEFIEFALSDRFSNDFIKEAYYNKCEALGQIKAKVALDDRKFVLTSERGIGDKVRYIDIKNSSTNIEHLEYLPSFAKKIDEVCLLKDTEVECANYEVQLVEDSFIKVLCCDLTMW